MLQQVPEAKSVCQTGIWHKQRNGHKSSSNCVNVGIIILTENSYEAVRLRMNQNENFIIKALRCRPSNFREVACHCCITMSALSSLCSGPQFRCFFAYRKSELVGGVNPSERYDRQIGNLPQIGVNIKNI